MSECHKCKKKKSDCGCNSGGNAQAVAIAELQDNVDTLMTALKAFTCGHPILLVENADDVASFDLDTGLGSDCWEGWALCNGETHKNAANKNIITPNFIDKFIVMAGGTYAVDEVGGEAEHTLTLPEIPSHKHAIVDPGHTHVLTDPGHVHAIDDDGHTHPFTDPGHTHTVDDHNHPINPAVFGVNYNGGTGPFGGSVGYLGSDTNYGGLFTNDTHLDIDSASTGISMDSAFTGIEVLLAYTGISIQQAMTGISETVNEGGGEPHNNLPPYYGALYVMKL